MQRSSFFIESNFYSKQPVACRRGGSDGEFVCAKAILLPFFLDMCNFKLYLGVYLSKEKVVNI